MKLTKALLLLLLLQSLAGICFGQQNLVYNHYFINPYLYNPSYLASNGHTELSGNFRKGWGDYQTATASIQFPVNYKIGIGANFYNDKAGIYRTNTGYLTFAYQVHFGKDFTKINRLGFGLSGGFTSSRLDLSEVSNPDDPAYRVTSVTGVQGQFGVNYQYQGLKIGFALPKLLKSRVVTSNPGDSAVSPFESTIATLSYDFRLSERISFEPYLLYRTNKNMPSQYEVLGVLKIDNVGWVGAAYRQEYGASAFLGLNVKERIKVGYAYEFAPNQVTGVGGGSHEVQLIVRLSKKKKERPVPVVEKVTGDIIEDPEEQQTKTDSVAQNEPAEKVEEPVAQPDQKVEPKTNPVKEEPVKEGPVEPLKEGQKPEEAKQENEPINAPVTENPEEKKPETKLVTKNLDGEALAPGHYVVVGAFRSIANAKSFTRTLKTAGYPAHAAFNPEKGYYIVHMGVTPTLDEAQRLRDVYRQKSRYSFKDTWILTIQ
jgi:type IX secretion system PorP/SprF family membrane protein